ncbi:hypothetical protein [Glutamicibacter sp. TV12E]
MSTAHWKMPELSAGLDDLGRRIHHAAAPRASTDARRREYLRVPIPG